VFDFTVKLLFPRQSRASSDSPNCLAFEGNCVKALKTATTSL